MGAITDLNDLRPRKRSVFDHPRSTLDTAGGVINPSLKGGALQIKSMAHNHFNPVRVWPDYDGPASNYLPAVNDGVSALEIG